MVEPLDELELVDEPEQVPAASQPLPAPRRFGVRDVMIAVALVAVLIRLTIAAGPNLSAFLAAIMTLAGIFGAIAKLVRRGPAEREPMLWVVANAAERRLPLEPGIEACGELCGGSFRAKARAVVTRLERGESLAEALGRVPGVFPIAGLLFVRMGWDTERLARALRDLIRSRAEWRPFRDFLTGRLAFLLWTLFVMQAVFSYFLYWIVPRLEAIFMDFGVDLPVLTRWTLEVSHLLFENPLLAISLLVLELMLLLVMPALFFDPLFWGVPIIDWFLLRRHGSLVLRALSGEVEMGRPLTGGLGLLAVAYPSYAVRRRIRRARREVDAGRPWADALAGVGLIRGADAAVLDAAQDAGNLAWALRDLADAVDRRFGIRWMAWTQLLYPLAILAVGAVVFVFAVAYFMPLVILIRELA